MSIVELDQACITPLTVYCRGPFRLRYAHSPSAICREKHERSQDYTVWRAEQHRVAFAVCDGVSNSFFGGIASQAIGEALIERLWKLAEDQKSSDREPPELAQALSDFLNSRTARTTSYLNAKDLSGADSEFAREGAEVKRERSGSQSNFVCGVIDIPGGALPKGRVLLFWLGDARLQAWKDNDNRSTSLLNAKWDNHEAWSSKFGVTGPVHAYCGTLEDVNCIIAHTDGVNDISAQLSPSLSEKDLAAALDTLGEDDVSFFEVQLCANGIDLDDDMTSTWRVGVETPVRIIKQIERIEVPVEVSVETQVPLPAPRRGWRWWQYGIALVVLGIALLVGVALGFAIGRSQPSQGMIPSVQSTPVVPSTDTPFALPSEKPTVEATIEPTSGASGSAVAPLVVQPSQAAPTPDGAFLLYPNAVGDGVNSLPLKIGYRYQLKPGYGLQIHGPFQVRGYPNETCDGRPIKTYTEGIWDPLSQSVLCVRLFAVPTVIATP